MEDQIKKPPLGVHPRAFDEVDWITRRNTHLLAAINRYAEDNRTVPAEWLAEYNYNIEQAYNIQQAGINYKPWNK